MLFQMKAAHVHHMHPQTSGSEIIPGALPLMKGENVRFKLQEAYLAQHFQGLTKLCYKRGVRMAHRWPTCSLHDAFVDFHGT